MALARTAVNRVTQASVGTRAMSSALKDMGGAIKPLVAFFQAPGVGTIDVNPTFTKGAQDGIAIPIVMGFIGLVGVPLAISGVADLLGGKNKRV